MSVSGPAPRRASTRTTESPASRLTRQTSRCPGVRVFRRRRFQMSASGPVFKVSASRRAPPRTWTTEGGSTRPTRTEGSRGRATLRAPGRRRLGPLTQLEHTPPHSVCRRPPRRAQSRALGRAARPSVAAAQPGTARRGVGASGRPLVKGRDVRVCAGRLRRGRSVALMIPHRAPHLGGWPPAQLPGRVADCSTASPFPMTLAEACYDSCLGKMLKWSAAPGPGPARRTSARQDSV